MKKIFITTLSVILFTQILNAQFAVGITAGGDINQQRVNTTEGNIYGRNDFKSYHAGFIKVLEAAKKNNAKVAVNVKN